MDIAFRRRFAFVDLEPSLGTAWREWVVGTMQLEATAADKIQQRLEQLNSTISADGRLGKAFRIGHSYCHPQPEPGRSLQPRLVRRGRGHRAPAPAARVLVRCARSGRAGGGPVVGRVVSPADCTRMTA